MFLTSFKSTLIDISTILYYYYLDLTPIIIRGILVK